MRERGEEGIEERGKKKETEQKEKGRERRRERGNTEREREGKRERDQKPETGGHGTRNNMFAWRPKGQGMVIESVIQPGGLSQAPGSM